MKFLKKYFIEIIVFIIFILYSGTLNLQFLNGANINYTFSGHDEYLTVKEVYSILEPASLKHFVLAIASGDIMIYGRVVFYVDAIIAYLPYKIFGLEGMVYSIRMTHVLFIFFGLTICSRIFLREKIYRVLFYLVILSLYYTSYFIMIPKPEPIQLFFISVFLYFGNKKQWLFGKHFFWLGLAYGAKFNALMILPLFFILPLFKEKINWKKNFISVIWFLSGVFIAVPALLLSPFNLKFFESYVNSTFKNTDHYDDVKIGFWDWIQNGFTTFYSGHIILTILLSVFFSIILLIGVWKYFKTSKIEDYLIISLIGFSLIFPVMILTKRIWPHYLWTGFIFFMLSIFIYFQSINVKLILKKNISIALSITVLIITSFSISKQLNLIELEKNQMSIKKNSIKAHNYIKSINNKFICVQDISVFYSFDDFLISSRYHPFSSPYPYPESSKKIVWSSFINPKVISNTKSNYILTYHRNFETKLERLNSIKDQMIKKDNEQMCLLLGKTIFLDTVIGEIRVYRFINEEVK